MNQIDLQKTECIGCGKEVWIYPELSKNYLCNACAKIHLNQESTDFEQEAQDEKDFVEDKK